MAVSINICNLALGELRASPIVDIDEDTIEARECARYFPQCLKTLLELSEWSFATKIASLAALTNNDRESEWLYAYALPADVGTPKRLVPSGVLASNRNCWPVCERDDWSAPYIVEAGTLYTMTPDAVLEYSAIDLPEAQMTALFIDALTFLLAARLAVPIRDSREMKAQLAQQAEVATQRAIADDRNRQRQRDQLMTDEVTAARTGIGCG